MPVRRFVAIAVLLGLACGPEAADPDDAEDPNVVFTADESVCHDFCLNVLATGDGCIRADVTCFDWCMRGLEFAGACGDEYRETRQCEAENPIDFGCEASACRDTYLNEELCVGYCFHLDGGPGGGFGPDSCYWRSRCYGRELNMSCSVGVEPTCSCSVDGVEISTCALSGPLASNVCGDEDMHLFKGCCTDAFLGEIQP